GHRAGVGIEDDARLPALELGAHLRDLLLQGELPLAVIGAFAQHEGFDHAVERLGGELPVGDEDGLRQSRRTLLRSRRSSMYSHTSVTSRANAEYHSMYFGAPPATPRSMKSKSSTRLRAATPTMTSEMPIPSGVAA